MSDELISSNGEKFAQLLRTSKSDAVYWSALDHDAGFLAFPDRVVGFAWDEWYDYESSTILENLGSAQERGWIDLKTGAKLLIEHRLHLIHSTESELPGKFILPKGGRNFVLSFFRNPAFVKLKDAQVALTEEYKSLFNQGLGFVAEIMLEQRSKRLAENFREERYDSLANCGHFLKAPTN